MPNRSPFVLPAPLPESLLLVGPPAWTGHGIVCMSSLDDVLARVPAAPDGAPPSTGEGATDDPVAPCLLLHGEHLEASRRPEALAAALEGLLRERPHLLPVLLFTTLDASACARLFEAGLFAAHAVPVSDEAWGGTCQRLAARREQWARLRAVRRQGEETARRLHAHRRQLQDEVARVGDELIASQRRLELVNQDLTDHMSQLALLYRFGRELSGARNWDAALSALLESLARFLGARGAALVLRAAPGGPYTPRQTYAWEESGWDRILLRLDEEVTRGVAASLASPGVVRLASPDASGNTAQRAITALPLEHQGTRLGYLLLLDNPSLQGEGGSGALPSCRRSRSSSRTKWPAPRCSTASESWAPSTRACSKPYAAGSGSWTNGRAPSTATGTAGGSWGTGRAQLVRRVTSRSAGGAPKGVAAARYAIGRPAPKACRSCFSRAGCDCRRTMGCRSRA